MKASTSVSASSRKAAIGELGQLRAQLIGRVDAPGASEIRGGIRRRRRRATSVNYMVNQRTDPLESRILESTPIFQTTSLRPDRYHKPSL
jgi:hypothetical protein